MDVLRPPPSPPPPSSLAAFIRCVPLVLLFFLATPTALNDHLHAYFTPPRHSLPSYPSDLHINAAPLSPTKPSVYAGLALPPASSAHVPLRAPALCTRRTPCSALVDLWLPDPPAAARPLLLAANGALPRPALPLAPPRLVVPARGRRPTWLADADAFLAARPYHYIAVAHLLHTSDWHVRVFNHRLSPSALNATLRLTLYPFNSTVRAKHQQQQQQQKQQQQNQNSSSSSSSSSSIPPRFLSSTTPCPTGPRESVPCLGVGVCTPSGRCLCDPGRAGRYCAAVERPIQPENNVLTLVPGRLYAFAANATANGTHLAELSLVPPRPPGLRPVLFGADADSARLSLQEAKYADVLAARSGASHHAVLVTPKHGTGNINNNAAAAASGEKARAATTTTTGSIVVGIYVARLRPAQHRPPRSPLRVHLRVIPCRDAAGRTRTACIIAAQRARLARAPPPGLAIRAAVVCGSVGLATVLLAFAAACAGRGPGVFDDDDDGMGMGVGGGGGGGGATGGLDGGASGGGGSGSGNGISEAEIEMLLPAIRFAKEDVAALATAGDVTCCVCLSAFDDGAWVRRLACGHVYHVECVDRWLLMRATCPRCRKPVRPGGADRTVSRGLRAFAAVTSARARRWWTGFRASGGSRWTRLGAGATTPDETDDASNRSAGDDAWSNGRASADELEALERGEAGPA